VVKLMPALTIEPDDLRQGIEILDDAVTAVIGPAEDSE
jgi:4-aminobutyrate aminotransferase-like enzyme